MHQPKLPNNVAPSLRWIAGRSFPFVPQGFGSRAQDDSGGGKGVAVALDGHPLAGLEGRL